MTSHTVTRYDDELKVIHGMVLELGELAQHQLQDALSSLREGDVDFAKEVVANDSKLNELDVKIDDDAVHIIAKRSPVAKDLREIMTILKIVSDLERVGDEARKIAQLTIKIYDDETKNAPSQQILRDIYHIAGFVDEMLEIAMGAFDDLDLDSAQQVIRLDQELDEECRSCLRRLSTFLMEDARSVGHFVDVVLGMRALERIGGHAKNIGGHVIYLSTGRDVRHENLKQVERQLLSE